MTLKINGENKDCSNVSTVAELLSELGLSAIPVLVEHNGTALYPREFHTATLTEADQLEIIRVVAGG